MSAAAIALLVAAMMDGKGTVAQRNDACFALRGQRSVEVVNALRGALADKTVRACAARDLASSPGVPESFFAMLRAAMRIAATPAFMSELPRP